MRHDPLENRPRLRIHQFVRGARSTTKITKSLSRAIRTFYECFHIRTSRKTYGLFVSRTIAANHLRQKCYSVRMREAASKGIVDGHASNIVKSAHLTALRDAKNRVRRPCAVV